VSLEIEEGWKRGWDGAVGECIQQCVSFAGPDGPTNRARWGGQRSRMDDCQRRSGVEREEQIVVAMLAGVGAALLAGATTPSAASPSSARV
jgi:hypothetical protein